MKNLYSIFFFFSSRRRHTRSLCDWSSDVCSSDLRRAQQRAWPWRRFDQVRVRRRYRTVSNLNTLVRPPKRPQNGRVPAELQTYRVTATAVAAINEDDGDIHLVLRDDLGATMIAESPEPACTVGAR